MPVHPLPERDDANGRESNPALTTLAPLATEDAITFYVFQEGPGCSAGRVFHLLYEGLDRVDLAEPPFLLAAGDDWTDEDLFRAMPEHAFTIKVGFATTAARHNVKSYIEVRALLNKLISGSVNEKTE